MNYRVLKFPQTVVSQNHFKIIGICTEKLAEDEHIFSIVQSFFFFFRLTLICILSNLERIPNWDGLCLCFSFSYVIVI